MATTCALELILVSLMFRYLYRSIIRWIQNPFANENVKEWPDLEELLIAASLAGIPWPMLREAFVRRLISALATHAGIMAETQDISARIRHMFNQSKGTIHRILYEFSFFVGSYCSYRSSVLVFAYACCLSSAGSSLWEIDRKYSRCAGTLPKEERDRMRETAMAVKDIDTFEKFWVAMGMDTATTEPHDVKRHIAKYFTYLMAEIPKWQSVVRMPFSMTLPSIALSSCVVYSLCFQQLDPATFAKIEPPKLEDTEKSVATMGMLKFRSEQARAIAAFEAEERRKHQGLPKLNNRVRVQFCSTCLICNGVANTSGACRVCSIAITVTSSSATASLVAELI
jgi:hypothetical protein